MANLIVKYHGRKVEVIELQKIMGDDAADLVTAMYLDNNEYLSDVELSDVGGLYHKELWDQWIHEYVEGSRP